MNKRIFDLEDITPWGQSRYDRLVRMINENMKAYEGRQAIELLDMLLDDIFENFHNKGGEK